MPIILHIHTGLEKAYVAVSNELKCLSYRSNEIQKEHGSFLQPAIQDTITNARLSLEQIDAISVINGPGSYTGLRIGLAAAKGLCFVLNTPLICMSTLEWLAWPFQNDQKQLICPLIDARRMEVFTAMYRSDLTILHPEHPEIIADTSFPEIEENKVIFTGNGKNKLPASIKSHKNVIIPASESDISEQIEIALKRYNERIFNDLAYTEPNYGKAFYTTAKILPGSLER